MFGKSFAFVSCNFICKFLYTLNWSYCLSCSRDLTLYNHLIPDPTLAGVECLVLVNMGKEYMVLKDLSKLKVRKIIISY